MNIDILHQYYLKQNQGGGSRFNQFAKYWSKNHSINVYSGMVNYTSGKKLPEYAGKIFVDEKENENIDIHRVHVSEAYNKGFLGRLWAYFSFTIFSTIKMLFSKSGDVLIATSPPLTVALTAMIIKKIKKIPIVFEIRDLWPESAIDTGVLKNKYLIKISYWIENKIYKAADVINVLTPAFKEVLVNRKGVAEDKVILVPNGADLDLLLPQHKNNSVRKKYDLEEKFVILYTGAHGVANQLTQLVFAAEKLKNNEKIFFLFVGDGMEKNKLKALCKEKKLENIIFIDSVPKDQIGDFINAADICTAVLQKNDTFKTVYPNKIFDYMCCRKPILLAIDGVAKKLVVEDAQSGIFVEPENSDDIVDAILEMKENQKLLDTMGENGYKFVINNFSRKKLAEKYVNYLSQLVFNNKSKRT